MILKDCIFLTLIIILVSRCTECKVTEDVKAFRVPEPCCQGKNILISTGCLEIAREAEKRSSNSSHAIVKYKKIGFKCLNGMYLLDTAEEPEEYSIGEDGTFYIGNHAVATKGMFCMTNRAEINDSTNLSEVDDAHLLAISNVVALVCFSEKNDTFLPPSLTGILAFISVGFLLLTILVYAIVPQLRDLQGKCMMCTAICLCLGFFHLAMVQIFYYPNPTTCQITGYLLYFWMLGAFFWMNVVSFNVMKSVVFRTSKISDKRTFMYYNIYGWGAPFVFLLVAVIADNIEGDHVKPGFGVQSCWFYAKVETWSYFYGPMTTLIVCNIILFIITSIKLWRQTNYENVTKIRSMRYKFLLYLKIFLVMGISWIFEIISYVHDTRHIVWLMMDTFNSLQGLVFFLVLVLFRKRALKGLASKGIRLPCAPNAHTGPDDECDEIILEEEAPALTTLS